MTTPSGAPAQAQSGQAHAQGSSAAQPPAPAAYPFPVWFYDNETQDGGQFSLLQAAAPQQFPIYNVTPTGWGSKTTSG
jgi:hypothetical protein